MKHLACLLLIAALMVPSMPRYTNANAMPSANISEIDFPGVAPITVRFLTPEVFHLEVGKQVTKTVAPPELMIVTPDSAYAPTSVSVMRSGHTVTLTTSGLTVSLTLVGQKTVSITVIDAGGKKIIEDWEISPNRQTVSLALRPSEHIFGFGDKRAAIDQRGHKLEMLNHDAYNSGDNDSYKSVPFYRSSDGYGLFFHTYAAVTFDVGKTDGKELIIDTKGARPDFYVFVHREPRRIISDYTRLTGRPAMLPRWAFGYHQSRASYTVADLLRVVQMMRREHLPFDAIYLDDYDPLHPPSRWLIRTLLRRYHTHLTIGGNPFFMDDSACRRRFAGEHFLLMDQDGKSVFEPADELDGESASYVDFFNLKAARDFVACEYSQALKDGAVLGMADFGELDHLSHSHTRFWPSLGSSWSAEELRNLYALAYAEALIDGSMRVTGGRSTGMIRAGSAGTQRYGWSTTGDSEPTWSSFRIHLRALINLSNTGFSNIGFDIGGWDAKPDPVIYARWFATGTFVPFMWSHGQGSHEPYAFGKQVESIARQYLWLRYRLLPYLYSLAAEAHRTGVPMLRSLSLENPQDEHAATVDDEFYLGDGMLVAPVMNPHGRQVYLPEGTWYDFFGDDLTVQQSGVIDRANVPLDRIPVYVRAGSIIPMGPVMQYSGEKRTDPLTIHYYAYPQQQLANGPKSSAFILYEDDGFGRQYESGKYRRTRLQFDQSASSLHFRMKAAGGNKNFRLPPRGYVVVVHGLQAVRVLSNGKELRQIKPGAKAKGAYWYQDGKGGTVIVLPKHWHQDLDIVAAGNPN